MCIGEDRSDALLNGSGRIEGKIINSNVGSYWRAPDKNFFKVFRIPFPSLDSTILLKIINPGKSFKKRKNYTYEHIYRCVIHNHETLELM